MPSWDARDRALMIPKHIVGDTFESCSMTQFGVAKGCFALPTQRHRPKK